MAILSRIRKRSGLLIALIGVAIAGFVLQDAFNGKGGCNRRSQTKYVGEINGEEIGYRDFEVKVEQQTEAYKRQMQKDNLSNDESFNVRQNTWSILLNEILMGDQYEKVGITVSGDELSDLFFGKFPHPFIIQNFTNPQTGQIDRKRVTDIENNFDQLKPEEQKQWNDLKRMIKEDRLRTKYNNLIAKSFYMPRAFAKRAYEAQSDMMKARMFAVDYNTIKDESIKLTDADYQKYYDEHKAEFEQEDSRDIDYVVFDIQPSKIDMEQLTKQVNEYYQDFQTTDNIADFVNSISDTKFDSAFIKRGQLSFQLDSIMFNSAPGRLVAPFIDNDKFEFAKLLDVQMRPDSMKASHILIAYQGAMRAGQNVVRTKEQAEKLADSLKAVVLANPAGIEQIAFASSDDGSAKENKGDLGWFTDGSMIREFNDAVVKGKIGDVVKVETPFGYHIIKITDKKAPVKKVRVALATIAIEPSAETQKTVFTKANKFAATNRTYESFDKAVQKEGLNKRSAEFVEPMSNNIPGLESARELVRWAFEENSTKGMVSDKPFEFNHKYVVAAIKEVRVKGIAPLEQIKTRLEYVVKREKKAEQLMAKLNAELQKNKDLYALAAMNNSAVDTVDNLNFASFNLGRRGYEPEVLGALFAQKKNTMTKALKGYSGVYVALIDDLIKAPAAADLTMLRRQYEQMYMQRVQNEVFRALQEKAEIKDNRYFFY